MNFDITGQISCIRQVLEKKLEYIEALCDLFVDFKKAYDSVRGEGFIISSLSFFIHVTVVKLIKICLNETCSWVQVNEHLSDMFPVKNGLKKRGALSALLFNFALEYAIRRVQANQEGLKFSGTHQLLVFADGDDNILGGSVHTIKKNTEAVVVTSKETGLKVH
jgi:hypothetical protein